MAITYLEINNQYTKLVGKSQKIRKQININNGSIISAKDCGHKNLLTNLEKMNEILYEELMRIEKEIHEAYPLKQRLKGTSLKTQN